MTFGKSIFQHIKIYIIVTGKVVERQALLSQNSKVHFHNELQLINMLENEQHWPSVRTFEVFVAYWPAHHVTMRFLDKDA